MNASIKMSRRAFAGGLALLGLGGGAARAQGFAGLGENAEGFAAVVPGRTFAFPADHGPHPEFRIEWWYVTANLRDAGGAAYGAQWTLFRQATRPGAQQPGWANQQIWMGHAAVTSADTHRYTEAFARGGVGQAGVEAKPFHAWIDSWDMRGRDGMRDAMPAPLDLTASGADFSYALRLEADRPLVLQGDAGYSRKSERGQASYYYSQPFFKVRGRISIGDKPVEVTGLAWLDREWSSQPLDDLKLRPCLSGHCDCLTMFTCIIMTKRITSGELSNLRNVLFDFDMVAEGYNLRPFPPRFGLTEPT
ncbi:MAG: carotenoid 1,2-hydratase, partial [Bradyrhizobium sp.]|nr:carotenoid 1,2-hydratase [Bradyrhizobium sp.]